MRAWRRRLVATFLEARERSTSRGCLRLRETRDVEIDCEEYPSRMAAYAEARTKAGRPVPPGFEKVTEHEPLCASCREETAPQVLLCQRVHRSRASADDER